MLWLVSLRGQVESFLCERYPFCSIHRLKDLNICNLPYSAEPSFYHQILDSHGRYVSRACSFRWMKQGNYTLYLILPVITHFSAR